MGTHRYKIVINVAFNIFNDADFHCVLFNASNIKQNNVHVEAYM